MPRDDRTFITVHDGMPEHPKVEGLSDGAFRLMVEAWCWCARNRTDGLIREASWRKRGTPRTRAELLAAGLVDTDDEGVRVHDYTEHQRTAAEIDDRKRKAREAGAKGGKARAAAQATAKQKLEQTPKQSRSESQADTETDTERARHTSSSQRARAPRALTSTDDPRFVEFWDVYPRREGKSAALRALAKAITASVPLARIVDGAKRYRDDPNREPAFTAHAATWLNAGRWDDDPQPQRLHTVRPTRDEDDPMGWAK